VFPCVFDASDLTEHDQENLDEQSDPAPYGDRKFTE